MRVAQRRARSSIIALAFSVAVLIMLCGCGPAAVPSRTSPSGTSASYQFDVLGAGAPQPQMSFSCLGVTDSEFKSILTPGYYGITSFSAGCSGLTMYHNDLVLQFNVRGAESVGQPSVTVPVGGAPYLPYAFYRFPSSMGQGGAVWQASPDGAESSPGQTSRLLVWLSFGGGIPGHDKSVAVTLYGPWRTKTMFKTDMVSALVQLVEWIVRGLAPLNPGWAPASFPATNPSPYVPPADGKLPSAPTKLPPLSSLGATSSSGGRS